MSSFFRLDAAAINDVLKSANRQYFVGNLAKSQTLPFLESDQLEVGMSLYAEFTADTPHRHSSSIECIFVIEGTYHLLMLEEDREVTLNAGDFIALPPGTSYASKACSVKALFIKAPGGNDKDPVAADRRVTDWLAS